MANKFLKGLKSVGGTVVGGALGGLTGGTLGGAFDLGFLDKPIEGIGDALVSTFTNRNEKRAARDVAKQLQEGTSKAEQAQKESFEKAFGYQQPYAEIGGQAFRDLYSQLGAGKFNVQPPTAQDVSSQLSSDPGVQYRQDQARKQFEAGAAARGNLLGSGALRAQQKISQDLSSQEYGNAYGRAQNRYESIRQGLGDHYNRLQSFANVGQQTAGNMSNLALGQGTAQAGFAQDQANILAGQTQANEASRANKSAQNLGLFTNVLGAGVTAMTGNPMAGQAVAGMGNTAGTQASAQGLNAMNYQPSSAKNYYTQFNNPMGPNLSSATYQSAQPGSNFMMGQQPSANTQGDYSNFGEILKKGYPY